ncbi:MAG: LPP20 family lipoprotein [Marinilabiliales bacterium]|nr:LPP20 family lipoprotein [Marinilabiliales bacterium]
MSKCKGVALIFPLLFVCGIFKIAHAQDIESIRADRQTYICGMGSGTTLKAADQAALTEIIEQISIQVESSFESIKTENNRDVRESVRDVVNTYSNATLTNTERIVLQDEPDARVFRYIKRSEVTKIFESRKNKIIELFHNGELALNNLEIADALRYFYWSQTLLRSHPEASDIQTQSNGKNVLLITWLPMQINQIFSNLKFRIDTIEQNRTFANYILNIQYKKDPVRTFDYTYWSGQDWSNLVSSKDGTGIVELARTEDGKIIRIKAEYCFEGEANIDPELRNVMEKLPLVPYKNSYFNINPFPKRKPVELTQKQQKVVSELPVNEFSAKSPGLMVPDPNKAVLRSVPTSDENNAVMNQVVKAISEKDFESVQSLFTEEGFSTFQKLLEYGHAQIIKSFDLKFYPYGDYVICRSIPMSFSFKTNNKTFIEDVVFYLDQHHKVCNLTFGLSSRALEDISTNASWSESNRVLLISFLENYKTAFSLKRFDYISSIFSDDALIITGFIPHKTSGNESYYAQSDLIRFNRQTKAEYLKRLKYSFDSKEYINIRFAENTIRQSGKGKDIYGIQIKQDYYSSTYGDSGYLFLLVDLSDSLKPLIHVRTWQPEKNTDGTTIGLADF